MYSQILKSNLKSIDMESDAIQAIAEITRLGSQAEFVSTSGIQNDLLHFEAISKARTETCVKFFIQAEQSFSNDYVQSLL